MAGVLLTSSSDAPASMSAAADKSVLGTPSGVDDLWAMMGMKKFSIMDDAEAKGEAPDLGQPLLSSMLVDIDLTPAADGNAVRVALSIKRRA